jgi:hypothetical protein
MEVPAALLWLLFQQFVNGFLMGAGFWLAYWCMKRFLKR